jgi:RHS repeat-associated protein
MWATRLASTPTAPTSAYTDVEYAPFGEAYGLVGTSDLNFTGQNQDTLPSPAVGEYDFLFREYNPQQGRWISPDPAGLSAVNPGFPQTWNRYAYVMNRPLTEIDLAGLGSPLGPYSDCIGCNPWMHSSGDKGGVLDVGFMDFDPQFAFLTIDPEFVANDKSSISVFGTWTIAQGTADGGDTAANNKTLPKCSSLGSLGVMAASLSLASQWTGTGYTLGVNGNGLKANIVGADIAASVALVSDPAGNVGIARSLSITPSVGARSYGAGIIIGGSTFSDLSGYSSYSNVNFTTTFGAGLATGFTESSNSSGLNTTAYLGFGTGGSAGAKGLSLTNNVQAFCKQ